MIRTFHFVLLTFLTDIVTCGSSDVEYGSVRSRTYLVTSGGVVVVLFRPQW